LARAPTVIAQRGELTAERDPMRPSGRWLRQAGMDASYVDLANPGHLEFDYLRWIRLVLRAARAHRVLHVGGGACALARALAAEDPGGLQEVCEVDADVLEMARSYLGLRRTPGLRVRQAEGRAHLARQPDGRWDAVVIDAFVGATVPRALTTVQAFAEVARVAPLGVINVVDNRSARDVRAVASALTVSYPLVWALGHRTGNTVVVGEAADLDLDLDRILARVAADPSPARLLEPWAMRAFVGGTPPRVD
jgi:spermidine synthase